jgi:cell division transport system permease protein
MAALGGAAGAAVAAAVGAGLRVAGGPQGISPALPVAWSDLLVVLACPAIAAGVAAVAARITAQRLIRDME